MGLFQLWSVIICVWQVIMVVTCYSKAASLKSWFSWENLEWATTHTVVSINNHHKGVLQQLNEDQASNTRISV